jgi:cytosine/adenosine deaminase-related metal-dependent hydrolase
MGKRKFSADQIFDGHQLIRDHVLVTDDNGRIGELIKMEDAGDDVEYQPGILSPGFVNCHCHLELSYLHKVIPENTGLVEFVSQVITVLLP